MDDSSPCFALSKGVRRGPLGAAAPLGLGGRTRDLRGPVGTFLLGPLGTVLLLMDFLGVVDRAIAALLVSKWESQLK